MRPKWEYKVVRMDGLSLVYREAYLNRIGQEGWELLVSDEGRAPDTVTMTFMRQIGGENAPAT
jgi:hypothetical protein